jgi:hypothetical protein
MTSLTILVGGVATSAAVGEIWGGAAALVITFGSWVLVIAGTVWLFRHARRSRR